MKTLITVLALTLLCWMATGCATPIFTLNQDVGYFGRQCEEIGYAAQSPPWQDCTQALLEARLSRPRLINGTSIPL